MVYLLQDKAQQDPWIDNTRCAAWSLICNYLLHVPLGLKETAEDL